MGSKNVREKAWAWPREELGRKGLDTRPLKKNEEKMRREKEEKKKKKLKTTLTC